MTMVCCTASAQASKKKVRATVPTTTAMAGPAATSNSSSTATWPADRTPQESPAFETSAPYERLSNSGS